MQVLKDEFGVKRCECHCSAHKNTTRRHVVVRMPCWEANPDLSKQAYDWHPCITGGEGEGAGASRTVETCASKLHHGPGNGTRFGLWM